MLILTRRRNEAIDFIDRATGHVFCTMTVMEMLPNDVVRLGFEADAAVRIVRDNAVNREFTGTTEEENGNGKGKDCDTDDESETRGNR